jgi:hypothetical protein
MGTSTNSHGDLDKLPWELRQTPMGIRINSHEDFDKLSWGFG